MGLINLVGYFIALQWSIASIFVILGLIGYFFYRPQKSHIKATNVEFVIVSKANESVSQVLFENIADLQNRYGEYPVNVVIDEGSILQISTGIVLKHVGFNRKTITEDFSFANELDKLHYHVWQSNSRVSVRSPNSVKDLIRQRNRWWRGISTDVQSASNGCKLFIGLRTVCWMLALTASWLLLPVWLLTELPWPWMLFNLIGASYFWMAYGYGAIKARKWWGIPLIPLLSIPEALAPWWHVEDKWNFNVIDKNNWNPP